MLIVEIDDRDSHNGAVAFGEDLKRDRFLGDLGYRVIRFTVGELFADPELIVSELKMAMSDQVTLRATRFGV